MIGRFVDGKLSDVAGRSSPSTVPSAWEAAAVVMPDPGITGLLCPSCGEDVGLPGDVVLICDGCGYRAPDPVWAKVAAAADPTAS